MPLDTCITNVGEYYSSHYLESTFAKDVKDLVKDWNELGSQSPPRRLQSLSQQYFRAKTQALDAEDPTTRKLAGDEVRRWHAHMLEALGYSDLQAFDASVEGGDTFVPALGLMKRYNKPWLIVCETHFCLPEGSLKEGMPTEDPLGFEPNRDQLKNQDDHKLCGGDWSRCIGRIFTEEDAPRWGLFLAGSHVLLLDRNTYAQGRYLAFDLDDAFGRKEKDTFNHIAAFLAAETLCPDGESDDLLLDELEEQSHRFAHCVTENLQFAVREAIELLVNEWGRDRTENQKLSLLRLRLDGSHANGKSVIIDLPQLDDGSYEITAEHLKREALVFVYRLLFCFYAEARGGELEILPIEEDTYRLGYSLESLRDLEQKPLTATTEDGTYFHEHIKRLFTLIHQGFHPHGDGQLSLGYETVRTFTMRPLTATLFAHDSTPLLNKARLSNRCLQAVIRKLSLSVDDNSKTIGRVNYAELGINQLGAVYEGLLSFKGMFADQDLIHVKPASGDFRKKKTPTWFVPKDRRDEFKKDEVERLPDGKVRVYTKGTFILHLNSVDREQSASYYTPEVLTKCLVEEALRELLKDYGPEDADKILELKVCEPAMGSGAFLNEAAEQLAHRYLELKQKQIDRTIEPAHYGDELRRVKHYITTRNFYGVDLNSTAVELGSLSLWLGSIHRLLQKEGENGGRDSYRSGATPWFGLRLRCGNSLIGARRAVWTADQLAKGRHGGKNSEIPRLLKPGEPRAEDEIYHFLVYDEDMVPTHKEKLMKDFWPERCAAAKKWITKQIKPKWKADETREALQICDLIDQQWSLYSAQRTKALQGTACVATVWPTPASSKEATKPGPTLNHQETVLSELEATNGSFQKLKLVMDTWCALWFWPLDAAGDLPDREAFLTSTSLLLGAEPPSTRSRPLISARLGFDVDTLLAAADGEVPDTEMLGNTVPWFDVGKRLALEYNFHHWELVFNEILGPHSTTKAFDLVLGNPPWIPASWSDGAVLSEFDPLLGVSEAKSADFDLRRPDLLNQKDHRRLYAECFRQSDGLATFLNSRRLYRELVGMKANLYKNFIVRSWSVMHDQGVAGLLHPEGPYSDTNGGLFRAEIYPRLRAHYQFRNQDQKLLFADIPHREEYSINIYSGPAKLISFKHMSNLFDPKTVGGSIIHTETEKTVPGIKTDSNDWNTTPHGDRVITIDQENLELFAKFLEDQGVPATEARLPQVHARQILSVLKRLTETPKRLSQAKVEYYPTQIWNERNSQRDGSITRQASPSYLPESSDEWVVSGPHFFVGNPFNKTPRIDCTSKGSYDEIDLTELPEDYLPRAVYKPGDRTGNRETFHRLIPHWPDEKTPVTAHYRHSNREMVSKGAERELVCAILPPGTTQIHTVFSLIFKNPTHMVSFHSTALSICFDFLVKVIGKGHCNADMIRMFPWIEDDIIYPVSRRGLRLNCLTNKYAELWKSVADSGLADDSWTSLDSRLCHKFELPWHELDHTKWTWMTPVRSDFSRRQALLEIDVLVAIALGFTLAELLAIYRVQFPVLRNNELNDVFDAYGRHIPSTTRKNQGGTQFRDALREWQAAGNDPHDANDPPLTVSWEIDDGNQTVTKTFYPPFTKVDREADYTRAYEVFQERYGG